MIKKKEEISLIIEGESRMEGHILLVLRARFDCSREVSHDPGRMDLNIAHIPALAHS